MGFKQLMKKITVQAHQWDNDLDALVLFIGPKHKFEHFREYSYTGESYTSLLMVETKKGCLETINLGEWIIREGNKKHAFTIVIDSEFKERYHPYK